MNPLQKQRVTHIGQSGSWIGPSALVSASLALGGGINYLFHVMVGRQLGADAFGEFGALLGLFYLLWLYSQSVQLDIARGLARNGNWSRALLPSIRRWGLALAIGIAVASGILAQGLHTQAALVAWLALVWLLCLPLPVLKGVLQGRQSFGALSLLNVGEPIIKLAIAGTLMVLGGGLWGIWAGWAMASLVVFFVALPLGLRRVSCLQGVAHWADGQGAMSLWVALLLAVPTNFDVIWAHHAFPGREAGWYAAAAVFGKGFLFLSMGVGSVLLPRAAADRGHAPVIKALQLAGVMNGLLAAACWLVPEVLVEVLLGPSYRGAAPLVRYYGLAMWLFSGVVLLAQHALATDRRGIVMALVMLTGLEVVAIGLLGGTPLATVEVLVGGQLSMLVWAGIGMGRPRRGHPSRNGEGPVALVTPYPLAQIKHGAKLSGVASYTKNLVEGLQRNGITPAPVVLANRDDQATHQEAGVLRCWRPGVGIGLGWRRGAVQEKPRLIHIQHETFLYGGALGAVLLPGWVRFLRRYAKVVITLHGFPPLAGLNREFLVENGLQGHPLLLRVALRWLYRSLVFAADCAIVHESKLKQRLVDEYGCPPAKIAVIPHGIELPPVSLKPSVAKAEMGLTGKKVVLYLGFLTGYKGIEVLIEGFSRAAQAHPDWVLVVAGGPHPRRVGERTYERYLETVDANLVQLGPQARSLGFVPQDALERAFVAADVVVFPYRVLLASSGPLALCMAYDRPFLASSAFEGFLEDVFLFDLTPQQVSGKLESFFTSDALTKQAQACAQTWRNQRNWDVVSRHTQALYAAVLKGELWEAPSETRQGL